MKALSERGWMTHNRNPDIEKVKPITNSDITDLNTDSGMVKTVFDTIIHDRMEKIVPFKEKKKKKLRNEYIKQFKGSKKSYISRVTNSSITDLFVATI